MSQQNVEIIARRVRQTVAHVWALRADRIVAWHVYFDRSEALEAVGLSE